MGLCPALTLTSRSASDPGLSQVQWLSDCFRDGHVAQSEAIRVNPKALVKKPTFHPGYRETGQRPGVAGSHLATLRNKFHENKDNVRKKEELKDAEEESTQVSHA